MDRTSKLADLTLVSKYYPVANYSYPRNEAITRYGSQIESTSDRSSLGSEGSAPGLIDDRTDSEVSVDDDYQYHAHASELWDSFWQPGVEKNKVKPEVHPRKQYPALIPSPPRRRRRQTEGDGWRSAAWPLPDSSVHKLRSRQAAATSTPFHKPIALPAPRKPTPSWQSSRPRDQPPRPPRPDERLLTPCIRQQSSFVTTAISPSTLSTPSQVSNEWCPDSPLDRRPTSPPEAQRPRTSLSTRPPTPADPPRPKTSHSCRPPTPGVERPASSRSLRPESTVSPPRQPRQCKSSRSLRPDSPPEELRRPKSSRSLRPLPPEEPQRPNSSSSQRPASPEEPWRPRSSRSLRLVASEETRGPKISLANRPPTPFEPESPKLDSHVPVPDLPKHGPSSRPPTRINLNPEPRSVFEDDSDCEEETGLSFFLFHKRSTSDLRRSSRSVESERKRHGDVFGRMLRRSR